MSIKKLKKNVTLFNFKRIYSQRLLLNDVKLGLLNQE
jgi:hypothetical protein